MKKIIFLFIFTLALAGISTAQNCKAFVFNKGQKLTYEFKTYPLTFESDPSMITGDTKYKVKKSIEFNEKLAAGKIAPKKVTSMVSKITDVKEVGDKTVYSIDLEGMATPINFQNICSKDSLVTILYGGRMAYAVKGDTSGIMLFGPTFAAAEPKVGTRVRGTTNVNVIADNSQIEPIRRGMYMPYNPISTSAPEFYSNFTNYGPLEGKYYSFTVQQPALVLREEKITVLGKEYTASVIGSETWSKMMQAMDKSFIELEQKYLQLPDMSKEVMKESSFEPGGKRLWKKKSGEMMDVNEHGFSLTYKEDWYVMGLGIVKSITYDASGAIIVINELKSVE